MKEMRVYGIDLDKYTFNHENEIELLSNKKFIDIAEEQGNIWSLAGFVQDFNYGGIGNIHLRFIVYIPNDPNLCCICHNNFVDSASGFDTCDSCLKNI